MLLQKKPPTEIVTLLSQSQGVVKYLANYTKEGKEEKVFRLKPDLVFCDRDRDIFPLILDMKYKSLNDSRYQSSQ